MWSYALINGRLAEIYFASSHLLRQTLSSNNLITPRSLEEN